MAISYSTALYQVQNLCSSTEVRKKERKK